MKIERICLIDKLAGKGVDAVFVKDAQGKIVRSHIEPLTCSDWGDCDYGSR